ncbi:thioredoxin-related transmembrane protein 1 [Scaptodrosophila lebanonensis]|uniref:Thioredoxin-related transmembrane protein 1 n=1 Tax=Drosophila lebanonensis TaxID=7225 RepID=A0A6J2TBD4_DROLE|nr:thioredoxin-related transmembrane protein 1 [Scaptodrosophila lebanonensis]
MLKALVLLLLPTLALSSALDYHNLQGRNDACGRGPPSRLNEGPVIEIDEGNWDILLDGEWLVSVCALNRDECKRLELMWHKLAASVGRSLNIGTALVNLSRETSLFRRLSVVALPTIYHVKDGAFRKLAGSHDVNTLRRLVEQQEWMGMPTLPFWQHPTSIWTCLSVFAYKAALELWRSGAVGNDYRRATWCMCFLFSSLLSTAWILSYLLWRLCTGIVKVMYARDEKDRNVGGTIDVDDNSSGEEQGLEAGDCKEHED